jgi:hypothetical protein
VPLVVDEVLLPPPHAANASAPAKAIVRIDRVLVIPGPYDHGIAAGESTKDPNGESFDSSVRTRR